MVSALPATAPRSAGLRRLCLVLAACYASFGALSWAYVFYVSTLPVTIPDDFGASAPGWVSSLAAESTLLLLPWAVLPVPLLICGSIHLRRVAPERWAWQAVWAGAAVAAAGLEAVILEGWAAPAESPAYYGPAVVDWRALSQAMVFVILGVGMAAVIGGAERSTGRQSAPGPHP